MSKQPLFRIASTGLKSHIWIYVRLCLIFVCLSVLVCLFTAFNMAMGNKRDAIFEENVSSNYAYSAEDKTELLSSVGLENFTVGTVERYDLSEMMKSEIQADVPTVTSNFITLEIGTARYRFSKKKTPEMLWLYRGDPFSDADKTEMQKRFGTDVLFEGEFPHDDTREVLISEKLLSGYGLTKEMVLGKTLSIWLGEDAATLFTSLKVTGVISQEYYQLSGHSDGATQIAPSVIAAAKNNIPAVDVRVQKLFVYRFDDWMTLSLDELKDLVSGGELMYCGIASYSQRSWLEDISIVVTNIYYIIGSILLLGLLLTVMLMIGKFSDMFLRTGGILLAFGLQQNKLGRLLFVQILLAALIALPLSLVASPVGYAVIIEMVSFGTGMTLEVSVTDLLVLSLLSVAVVFCAAMAFFGVTWLRVKQKSVREMLSDEF